MFFSVLPVDFLSATKHILLEGSQIEVCLNHSGILATTIEITVDTELESASGKV